MEALDQSDYFSRRAEEERVAADKAGDERAARTHRALAARYTAKAKGAPLREVAEALEIGGTLTSDFTILPSSPPASHS
jgi:hypothetical protein